MSIIPK